MKEPILSTTAPGMGRVAPGTKLTVREMTQDSQPTKCGQPKHRHGWDCFRESGGYTNAMDESTPLSERIETVYKTAYRTASKNARFEDPAILALVGAAREVNRREMTYYDDGSPAPHYPDLDAALEKLND